MLPVVHARFVDVAHVCVHEVGRFMLLGFLIACAPCTSNKPLSFRVRDEVLVTHV